MSVLKSMAVLGVLAVVVATGACGADDEGSSTPLEAVASSPPAKSSTTTVLAAESTSTAVPATTVADPGPIAVLDLEVGDCFDDGAGQDEAETVLGVACENPHLHEVYAVYSLREGTYPGDGEVEDAARSICRDGFAPFVGEEPEESDLDYLALFPSRDSWQRLGDRDVVCAVYRVDGDTVTGSRGG